MPRAQAVLAGDRGGRQQQVQAVNSRDRNFTPGEIDGRQRQIEESIHRYLQALDTADPTQPADVEAKTERLQEKIQTPREQMRRMDFRAIWRPDLRGYPDTGLESSVRANDYLFDLLLQKVEPSSVAFDDPAINHHLGPPYGRI